MSQVSQCMDFITLGVYEVGVRMDDTWNFMTAAWVTQVSSTPNRIAVAIGSTHYTAELIEKEKNFSLSVLAEDQVQIAKICGFKSGKKENKSELVDYELNKDGLPVIKDAAAYMNCTLEQVVDIKDHKIIIAEVISGETTSKKPLLYDAKTYFG